MQKKTPTEAILILLLLLVGIGFYSYDAFVYQKKIEQIHKLDKDIERKNEQLIAAQILDKELSGVATLIQQNLTSPDNREMIKSSAVNFLKFLTHTLDAMKIELLSIQPIVTSKKKKGKYLESSYRVEIFCNYKKMGQLVTKIEKSDRIIRVDSFEVKSNIDYLQGKNHSRGIENRVVELELTTLTLLKS
ncbi:MAG: hypothetical protein B6244_09140 [Candidatus Cloacimonetes bacterium 4572_55]|nr:MAG: hypothetical protein B6244_09140 [Candidatus Cloacimonetes bacterium 4572_55]